ncbi:MAG: GTPase ObgE [Candidatus Izemoplasmatales bacterium]|nr:GTPase ObgE [Candidatus Izemoplasmatales bacterium]
MFLDEVTLLVESGKGGDGIISFRREKHVPKGGPAGGDGGKGGSVIFVADEGLSTLFDLKYTKAIRAKNGENGKIKTMRGKDAEDVFVKVPIGTMLYEQANNEMIADLTTHGERYVVARGGRGGRGNTAFATARNKVPRIQENGEPGESVELRVELKLLADVGIIGFPSVGKSTIISAVTNSRPKIADYPFTTLIPNLGVVALKDGRSFVLADMPGLIEGASQGLGLGIQFLKHIERTRILLHVIDMSGESERDPYKDWQVINDELSHYVVDLSSRPQILVANKMDAPKAKETLDQFKKQLPVGTEVFEISAALDEGLEALLYKTMDLLTITKAQLTKPDDDSESLIVRFRSEELPFYITKPSDGWYDVQGPAIERLYRRSNFMSDEAVSRFLSQLRRLGVEEALRKEGAKNEDMVRIYDFEFEFVE